MTKKVTPLPKVKPKLKVLSEVVSVPKPNPVVVSLEKAVAKKGADKIVAVGSKKTVVSIHNSEKTAAPQVTPGFPPKVVSLKKAPPPSKVVARKGRAANFPPPRPMHPTEIKASSKLVKNLAARPAGNQQSPVRIFQIYYEAWQKELLDPAFAPLDNSKVKAETMEFDVFEKLSRSSYVKGSTLWGALSWRYTEKTGLSGADLIKAIEAKPGMDVYYCNPHIQNEALFHNMWVQGETTHPKFLALSNALFAALGLPPEELTSIKASPYFSSANYFVASPAFWEKYLPFIRKILTMADKKLTGEARDLLHSAMADDRGVHKGATYVPFIVERLFPLFMKTDGKGLKAHKIALPEREREMNVHLKLLREMKDLAVRTKSPFQAACWINYRNLYLSQTNGKAWCQKYLRAITPTQIKFD